MADIPDFSHKSSVRTMKPLQLSIRDRWPKVMLAMVVEIKGAHHPRLLSMVLTTQSRVGLPCSQSSRVVESN
jgi:hypothetical protein